MNCILAFAFGIEALAGIYVSHLDRSIRHNCVLPPWGGARLEHQFSLTRHHCVLPALGAAMLEHELHPGLSFWNRSRSRFALAYRARGCGLGGTLGMVASARFATCVHGLDVGRHPLFGSGALRAGRRSVAD